MKIHENRQDCLSLAFVKCKGIGSCEIILSVTDDFFGTGRGCNFECIFQWE